MEKESSFVKNFEELLLSINLCSGKGYYALALILVYSTIDFLAYLDLPKDKEQAMRKDFVKWVEKYLLPDSLLKCTAWDLYSARCSLAHTSGCESGLSKNYEAKKIYYVFGIASVKYLMLKLLELDLSRIKRKINPLIEKIFFKYKFK